jgi:hypothetical protein
MVSFLIALCLGFGCRYFYDDIKREVNKFLAMRKRLKEDETGDKS